MVIMTHLIAEKLAKLLKISIEQAEKIAPQLQHEILIDTIASTLFSLFVIVFLLSLFAVLFIFEEYDNLFKPSVWVIRISFVLAIVTAIVWQFLTPTLKLFEKLK